MVVQKWVSSMNLELRVANSGLPKPNASQKWVLSLTLTHTPLLFQSAPASSGWAGALDGREDCNRCFQHHGQDSTCPRARRVLPPGAARGCWAFCLIMPGERRSPKRHRVFPALNLSLLSYSFLWICPCILELKAHALTGFSYRQLHEGVGRGVRGEKGQALADGGGRDFPHKLPSRSVFTTGSRV